MLKADVSLIEQHKVSSVHAKTSPAMKRAAEMPLLRHFLPGQAFDISKSEVVQWLCDQPEIQQALFNWYKRNGAIVYEDGQWRGANWRA
jgi:hypothetical protein